MMGTTKKSATKKKKVNKRQQEIDLFTEIIGICIIGIAILILTSLFTNQVGIIGEGIRSFFVGVFGIGGYIMPFYCIVVGGLYIKGNFEKVVNTLKYVMPLIIIIITFFHLISYGGYFEQSLIGLYYMREGAWYNGGWLGAMVASGMLKLFGIYGTYILLGVCFGVWLLIATKFPIFSWIQETFISGIQKLRTIAQEREAARKTQPKVTRSARKMLVPKEVVNAEDGFEHPPIIINHVDEPQEVEVQWDEPVQMHREDEVLVSAPAISEVNQEVPRQRVKPEELQDTWNEIEQGEVIQYPYVFPAVDLLYKKELKTGSKNSSRNALNLAKKLEDTLMSFGVEAKVTQINQGPTVTRYELQPKQGVKVSKIVNLADDIALNLAAAGIRIEAPIPGKAAVGIEVPNENSEVVYLREVIDTDQFVAFPSKLAFALGRDIGGKPIIADIGKMPHMLIAGATGSGKSVCINTLITSILYKAKPSEVKLIMIDPKVVELNVYNGIPHLMIPVVTDPKKAAGALSWAVNEMTKRYQMFAENNVRDMKGYNSKMEDEALKMPNIVIIIDELADLMMTAAKEVEDAICRLAQMARAAGIHLVIATQRPSVDVITGVIKANIPSRLAFAVSSGIDSRTILDMNGAEKLLGKGDMLFYPVGESKPIRIQGAFISDREVESIVEAVKQSGEVKYEESIIESISAPTVQIESSEEDELVVEAIQLTVGKDKISISMLQRYFRIGFNRASRLMDALEARGIVGPDEGSKPRKVLQNITHKEEE